MKRRRISVKSPAQDDLRDHVKAYSGFSDRGNPQKKVRRVDFHCFGDSVLRHAAFTYTDGRDTRPGYWDDGEEEEGRSGQKAGSVVLAESEHITEIATSRAGGVDLRAVEVTLSSGRLASICAPGVAAESSAHANLTAATVRAPPGFAIINFDALVRCHPKFKPSDNDCQELDDFLDPGSVVGETDYHHFKSGVVMAPLSGSHACIPEIVLCTDSLSHALCFRNDFAGGNLCHVLCSIGSAEAAKALDRLASMGGRALFSQPDADGRPPVFYAVSHQRSAAGAPECLRVLLEHAPGALQYRLPGSGCNLAHLAAQHRHPEMLEVLAECGGVASLFSERRGAQLDSGDGFTPAHDAAYGSFDFVYDAGSRFGDHDPCASEAVGARADCLRVLHARLKEHFGRTLDALAAATEGPSQSYSEALHHARHGIQRAVSLRERDAHGRTPLEVSHGLAPLLEVFHEIGGVADMEALFRQACRALNSDHPVVRGLLSSPKYLSVSARQEWLQSAMAELVAPGDGEGLVLDVADWDAPLLGACEALGVSDADGHLTTARPARLHVRMGSASGEAAAGDGLRRQWLQSVSAALLEPDHGLFVVAGDGTLLPNPHSATCVPDHLAQFALLGRIIGLALLHGEQLGRAARCLNPGLLVQVLGLPCNGAGMLALLDPELSKQLEGVRQHAEEGCDLGLTFSLTGEEPPEYMGQGPGRGEELLKPRGDEEAVGGHNLDEYLALRVARHVQRWREGIGPQLAALSGGLGVLLPAPLSAKVARAMRLPELLGLLGGAPCIDDAALDDWRGHTGYSAGLGPGDPLSQWFWRALRGFSPEQRAQLLRFATGSLCPPALGFSRLPGGPFTLHRSADPNALPTASTCFCILRLPTCATAEALRSKLLLAVEESSGFSEAAVALAA